MSKFWSAVAIVFLVTVGLLAVEYLDIEDQETDNDIMFSDLETECRLQPNVESTIGLEDSNSLSFEGQYPEEAIDAELGYDFRQTSDEVLLNIKSSSNRAKDDDLLDDCIASVRYKASTEPIPPGTYLVTLQHNGQTVQRQIIEIKRD